MAGAGLTFDDPGAARAIAAIVRHAAAQPDGLVSLGADGEDVVLASPGETSLLLARLPSPGGAGVPEGTYAAPGDVPDGAGDGAPVTVRRVRGRLQVSRGVPDHARPGV